MVVHQAKGDDEGERDRGGGCQGDDKAQSPDRGFQGPHDPSTARKVHEIEDLEDTDSA